MPYVPALDGLRGLAVAAVLLFHGGFAWARGGYLGVSTFFTLSGFLITALLIGEHRATGHVVLRRFWARRMRRLLPASALTLAAVSLSALFTDQLWERTLRGDVIAALLQAANWRFLFDDRPYGELFTSGSPVLHFWSLAIEEQFYWVFPLVTAGVLAVAKGSARVYGTVLGALIGVSLLSSLAWGPVRSDIVYYATFTRMGEILVGALLAVVLHARWGGMVPSPSRVRSARRLSGVATAVGVVALAASGWAWWNVEQGTQWLYRGGLLAYALASAGLLPAALVPGPLNRLLSIEPLRRLGVISYGVYLVHWPVFLLVDADRVGLDQGALFGLRLAVTLAFAAASYVFVERPIRAGWRPRLVPMPALAGGAVASVLVVAIVVPRVSPPPSDPYDDPYAATRARAAAVADAMASDAPKVLFFGQSTMIALAGGVAEWGLDNGELVWVGGFTGPGCGFATGGHTRRLASVVEPVPVACTLWERKWSEALEAHPGDVAVVMSGPWDTIDHRIPGDDRFRPPTDPVFAQDLYESYLAATDLLLAHGLTVVWLTMPEVEFGRGMTLRPEGADEDSDPARVDAANALVRQVARERSGVVVVEFGRYIDDLPRETDERLRPDGGHFTEESAREVADWLGPQILDAATSAT
ncbi:MAG: acyltransferase family protein [Acidimicrobiales bacterium]|nr:acyltransferase family protein [Acidimicrobiales bacterium]